MAKKRLNQFLSCLLSLLCPPDNVAAHISDGQDSAIPEFTLTLLRLIRTRKSSNRCFGEADCGLDPRTIGLLLPLGLHAVFEHRARESDINALSCGHPYVAIRAVLGWSSAIQCRCQIEMTIIANAATTDREIVVGLVERVTYQNADNGFCVVRVKARGHRNLVRLVGHAATISAGEWITATGGWVNDRTHGQQFRAQFLKTSAPSSLEGIEKYLASGMIRGIGPVYAKRLLRAFGEKVFDVIEAEPDRLRSVNGIGTVRASRIVAAWAEQKVVREIMVFLHSHGVGTARAVRIFKTYGADAVQKILWDCYSPAPD